jgi:sterol desaturase/sphingolipid hydroxylase (fatty acid hydroxylase superfamily)
MTATVCCQAGRENPTAGRLTAASRKRMGLLTTEHGKAGYLADFIVYAVAATALAVLLAIVAPYVRRTELLAFALLGLAAWTFVEYVLHRFVLHGMHPFRAWHAEHHRRPRALIGTPTILSTALIAALVFLPALVLSDLWRASALTFGLLTGYMVYAIVHHATHHWRAETAWLRRIKRHHALHHSPVAAASRYGVTSAFWDVVFRTNGTSLPHATS